MTRQAIEAARQLHLRGQFAQAIAGYDAVLASEPGRAEVWHLKGMAEHQSGQLERAHESATRAIEAGGEQPVFLMLAASVLHDRGDLAGAEGRFQRVAAAKPGWIAPLLELGTVRLDLGRFEEALSSFRAASDIDATSLRAWNGIGLSMLNLGRLDEADRAFKHALTIDSRYAYAHFNLGRICNLRSDWKRALEHATYATRFDPRLVDAHILAGDLQRKLRQPAAALAAYTAAVAAAPDNVKARIAQTELLAEMGRTQEAVREARSVLERFPGSLRAALAANLLLPQVYQGVDHMAHVRVAYLEGLERLHEAAPRFRFARGDVALAEARWTNFYLAYQGEDDRRPQQRYGEFLKRVLEPAVPELYEPIAPRANRERIRVGFLSHFFYNCTVGRYFASWLTGLDRSKFELVVFYTNEWVADDTRAIAAAVDRFHHLPGRSTFSVAQHVKAEALDILVYPELGMHPETFTLASLRLAPVQCAAWGHPDTTGHASIDWFISCEAMEPPGAQERYGERLALLPGLGTRYALPASTDASTRADFGLPEGRRLYLLPQSLFKIHPDNDELVADVIQRDPEGMLVAFASQHDHQTNDYARRLSMSFQKRRLDLGERATFIMPSVPHAAYLRLNALCDVMLDTLHWSGGNTSLDALAAGLPVVTLPGSLMRGRQSRAMLEILGVGELVAADVDDYVDKAVAIGRDPERREALAGRIRAGHGELFGRDEPLRALERFFESVVS